MNYFFINLSISHKIQTKVGVDKFKKEFFSRIDKELDKAYFKNTKKDINFRQFNGTPFRFVWNGWNLFNPIIKGKIEIVNFNDSIYLKHKIFFLEFFVYCVIFSIIPVLGFFDNIYLRILSFAIIWIIYLISTLLSSSRLQNLFNIIIQDINNEKRA